MTRVATSADDAHFAAIAAVEAADENERIEWAARMTPGERVLLGMRLCADIVITPALLAEIDAQADGQMELARRRIALGLTERGRT